MTQIVVPAREGRAVKVGAWPNHPHHHAQGRAGRRFLRLQCRECRRMAVGQPHLGDDLLRQAARGRCVHLALPPADAANSSKDGANGVHDMMIAACDQFRYEFFGHKGPHASCSENLCVAMRRLGPSDRCHPAARQFLHQYACRGRRALRVAAQSGDARRLCGARSADGSHLRGLVLSRSISRSRAGRSMPIRGRASWSLRSVS